MTDALAATRPALVRRGLRLGYATAAYNSLEGVIAPRSSAFTEGGDRPVRCPPDHDHRGHAPISPPSS